MYLSIPGDHTVLDLYLTVVPPKTEAVVFSIDGSFTASVSVSGKGDFFNVWTSMFMIFYEKNVNQRPNSMNLSQVADLPTADLSTDL